jgi:MtaA/CmuA family methyltransferase
MLDEYGRRRTNDSMNGYERIQAALQGRWSDRTPVMLHNFLMAAEEAGYTQEEYRNDPKKISQSHLQAVEKYGYDGIMIEMDTTVMAGSAGVPVDFPVNDPARVHEPLLTSIEEVTKLKRVRVEDYRYVQITLEAVRLTVEHSRNEIFVRGNCDQAAFSIATMIRTPSAFMMDLLDTEHEDLVFELLEYCTDVSCQYLRLMVQTGCHMLSNGDSPAGPDMISPQMYERFALPFEKRNVEVAQGCGFPYGLHICGDTVKILDAMVRTGTDALELDYKTDTEETHRVLKDRVTFIGNIDPSGIIGRGTADQVRSETEKLLTIFSDTPRFILNAGCAIPQGTPSENIRTLMDVAKEFTH